MYPPAKILFNLLEYPRFFKGEMGRDDLAYNYWNELN